MPAWIIPVLRQAWPYLLAGTVGFSLAWGLQGLRLDSLQNAFDAYHNEVKAQSAEAFAHKVEIERQQKANLDKVKGEYEANLPAVRAGAVSAYLERLRKSGAGGGAMRGITVSLPAHDGAAPECFPDREFVADCSDDALKVQEWQAWAKRNNIPGE